ncbi:MAG: hypothetical protein HGA97_04070 [Chlorobiaceae bacterium]|jgi:hypothetical protein|nr:hypothetical protein [Chlorobiaceae bacterium]
MSSQGSTELLRTLFEEYSEWYFSLAEEEGVLPRSVSGVADDGKQFIYLMDSVSLPPLVRNKYIRFVLHEHHSKVYAYGGVALRGDSEFGEIEEVLDVVTADSTSYLIGHWRVLREEGGLLTGLQSMGIHEGDDLEKYPGTWFLAGAITFTDAERIKYGALWEQSKPEAMFTDRNADG